MTNAKIEIRIGSLVFASEGDENWVSKQLDHFVQNADKLTTLAAKHGEAEDQDGNKTPVKKGNPGTLAAFLSGRNATTSQVRRFLATAAWLHLKGKNRLTTTEVSAALTENSQKKLSNPSDCLGQNVGKGYCEKDGKSFYVTDDGYKSVG